MAEREHLDDRTLVARILEGDRDRFTELVKRYEKRIINYVYRITHRYEDAHDLERDRPAADGHHRLLRHELRLDPRITLANRLCPRGFGGCAAYGTVLRRMFPGAVLPVGYSDSVFGYLPTTTMLGQRGYEDSGFMRPFGLAGQFRPELERVVLDAWERLTR